MIVRVGSAVTFFAPLLGTLLGTLLYCGEARAQGFIIPETGARKNAMGAVIGRPDELSAAFHNPAGLTLKSGSRAFISFGSVFLDTRFRLKPWPGSEGFLDDPVDGEGYFPPDSPSTFAVIPMIAVATNLWSEKLVAAASLYVPNAAGGTFGEDSVARYHMIEGYLVTMFTTLSLAYQPLHWLSLGGGFTVGYVRLSLRRALFPPQGQAGLGAIIGTQTEFDLVGTDWVPGFNFGVLVWPHRTVSIGLAVISAYDVTMEGDVKITLGEDSLLDGRVIEGRHSTETKAPWIIMGGVNWDALPWLEVGAELRFYTNSRVDEQHTTFDIDGLPLDDFITPKDYHDSYQLSAGVNVHPELPLALEFMAGFHYEPGMSPEETITADTPAFDHWGIHTGVRWTINERYWLALAYWHYFYLETRTDQSRVDPPMNFIGEGHSDGLTVVFETRFADGLGL